MRPLGTSKQLLRRRQQARALLQRGQRVTEIAKRLGTTPQSVCRWRREAQQPKRQKRKRRPGRPSQLSASQLRGLVAALKRGAYAYGYTEDYWTLERIAHLIWELFQVRYGSSRVWYLMQRRGWSCQKPQRRSLARDEQAIVHWKRYVWPQIKKVSATGRNLDFPG
jgi:transposase